MVRVRKLKLIRPVGIFLFLLLILVLFAGIAAAQDGNVTDGQDGGTTTDVKTPEEKAEDTQRVLELLAHRVLVLLPKNPIGSANH